MATSQSHGPLSISRAGLEPLCHLRRPVRALHAGRIVRTSSLGPRLGWSLVRCANQFLTHMDRRVRLEPRARVADRTDFWHDLQLDCCAPRAARDPLTYGYAELGYLPQSAAATNLTYLNVLAVGGDS